MLEKVLENEVFDKTNNLYKVIYTLRKEMFGKKKLLPNIELYVSGIYLMMGIPARLVANVNLMARISGICAHMLEQKYVTKKILLRHFKYVGQIDKKVMKSKF